MVDQETGPPEEQINKVVAVAQAAQRGVTVLIEVLDRVEEHTAVGALEDFFGLVVVITLLLEAMEVLVFFVLFGPELHVNSPVLTLARHKELKHGFIYSNY